MTDWFDNSSEEETERLLLAWEGAPVESPEVLGMLLDVARQQVESYAPEREGPSWPVPGRLIYAQLQQARNLWNAGAAGGNGEIGADGFSYQPRPLDKTIRAIIRPTTGAADAF